jgi:putative transcriptional regulator
MTSKLAPGYLVAAPSLRDPNFRRSVVLLVDHRPEGSLGFVLNRPAEVPLGDVVEPLGLRLDEAGAGASAVLIGGPMAPNTGWVVFEPDADLAIDEEEEVVSISERLAVSASRELLERLLQREGPERMTLVLGYAGWGPGQLDEELAHGAWIPVDFDHSIVFDTPHDERWGAALRLLGIDPARLTAQPPTES